MAKQTGLIKVRGTLDNVNFYKSKDGDLARMKSSVDKHRIESDPAFARTRENGSEFAIAAHAGKLFRDAVKPIAKNALSGQYTSRIFKLMFEMKYFDTTSTRGERSASIGIDTLPGKSLLKHMDFNENALLGNILLKPYTVDMDTGIITIENISLINDIEWPDGATHVSISGGFASIDFLGKEAELSLTNEVNLVKGPSLSTVILTPDEIPTLTGVQFFLLKVAFYQEVNGSQYALKNGAYNALRIIEVK